MDDQQGNTKKQLVDAAIDLFHEKGYQKTRVSDIVAQAGVAQGTFYLYFKSKEDVFLHISSEFTALFSRLITEADDFFQGPSIEEIRNNLFGFIREMISLFIQNEKLTRIVFNEGSGYGGPFCAVYEGIHAQFVNLICDRLEKNRGSRYVVFEDAETVAAILFGMFDRCMFYFMEIKKQVDVDALSRRMTDFIMGGLIGLGPDNRPF